MGKSLILLSGGLDSALNLALAAKEKKASLALTFSYGQKAQEPEIEAAQFLADYYKVPWQVLNIDWLGRIHKNALTEKSCPLPHLSLAELDSKEKTRQSAAAVWVANRNGLFLNIGASFAEAMGMDTILVGFNQEEASTFPDNSSDYVEAINRAFSFSTLKKVRVQSYTLDWDKKKILSMARQMDVPLDKIWFCYGMGPEPCGLCESCVRFQRAKEE